MGKFEPFSKRCTRCGYYGHGRFAEPKTFACLICGFDMVRMKAIYRETLREKYVCTNENCRVIITTIMQRVKEST